MKECPTCGHRMKDHHQTCVKCGAEARPPEPAPADGARPDGPRRPLEQARYLRELLPRRERVSELLPHPAGWVLGIGVSAVVVLAVVHALIFPASADATDRATPDLSSAAAVAQQSQFQRCLHQARARTELQCAGITGTAQGVRRMTCTVARLSADYARCTARLGGRFGRCLGSCGQAARSCSSRCAATAPADWMSTARCLLPCWRRELQTCVSSCFRSRTLDADPTPSAI